MNLSSISWINGYLEVFLSPTKSDYEQGLTIQHKKLKSWILIVDNLDGLKLNELRFQLWSSVSLEYYYEKNPV